MMHWGYYGGWGAWGLHVLLMALFWALVIGGGIALVRLLFGTSLGHSRRQNDSAMDVLDRRYAKGEISKEEYQERKDTLVGRE